MSSSALIYSVKANLSQLALFLLTSSLIYIDLIYSLNDLLSYGEAPVLSEQDHKLSYRDCNLIFNSLGRSALLRCYENL